LTILFEKYFKKQYISDDIYYVLILAIILDYELPLFIDPILKIIRLSDIVYPGLVPIFPDRFQEKVSSAIAAGFGILTFISIFHIISTY